MFSLRCTQLNRFASVAAFCAVLSMLLSSVPLHACCCELRFLIGESKTESNQVATAAKGEITLCSHCERAPAKLAKKPAKLAKKPAKRQAKEPSNATGCQLAPQHGHNCCDYECDCCRRPAPQLTTASIRQSSLIEVALFATPTILVEASDQFIAPFQGDKLPLAPLSAQQRRALLCCWLN